MVGTFLRKFLKIWDNIAIIIVYLSFPNISIYSLILVGQIGFFHNMDLQVTGINLLISFKDPLVNGSTEVGKLGRVGMAIVPCTLDYPIVKISFACEKKQICFTLPLSRLSEKKLPCNSTILLPYLSTVVVLRDKQAWPYTYTCIKGLYTNILLVKHSF